MQTLNWQGTEAQQALTKMKTFGLQAISSIFTIPFLNNIYNEAGWLSGDNLARSVTQVYTRDPNDDASETEETSYEDSALRRVTRRNYVAAGIMNLLTGQGREDNQQQTGYGRREMPLQVMSDPVNSYWNQVFYISDAMSTADRVAVCDSVISMIEKYGYENDVATPEKLTSLGIMIPYRTQQACYDYIQAQINAVYNQRSRDLNDLYLQGLSYDQEKIRKNEIYDQANQQLNRLYSLKSVFGSGTIPHRVQTYNVWDTNYRVIYRNTNTNEVGTFIDYNLARLNGDESWTKEYYASGDHRSSINPFNVVDQVYNTYDEQTPVAWYDTVMTTWDELYELYHGVTFATGMYAGMDVYDLLSGEGNADATMDGFDPIPVVGSRAWIPNDMYDGEYLLDPTREDAWNPLGADGIANSVEESTPSYGGGGGYSRSYGSYYPRSYSRGYSRSYGGGGSYEYDPKIYSNPAYSLNTDRPATMYSKVPYSTTFDYLRPDFQTKGSREAYLRSDV